MSVISIPTVEAELLLRTHLACLEHLDDPLVTVSADPRRTAIAIAVADLNLKKDGPNILMYRLLFLSSILNNESAFVNESCLSKKFIEAVASLHVFVDTDPFHQLKFIYPQDVFYNQCGKLS